jgi:PAB-dependent poly(A)-specific ribonuclease subunit 2
MTLIPLKVAYKKLRFLVDRGCIFIGHGLAKDFRIISEPSPALPAGKLINTVQTYMFLHIKSSTL